MRKFLTAFVLALAFVPGLSLKAQAATEPTTAIVETMSSTMTCLGVQISNSAGTMVLGSTVTAHRYVTVNNTDASAALWCAERSAVSVTAASVAAGFKITAGQSVFFALVPGMPFYCRSDGGASTWASVCRGR